jgi:hypothetical protein|nr:MAG TPA: HNH endonuclease bacteriophage, HNH Endonuclease, DNA.52A [Caudoviricetes sp.]
MKTNIKTYSELSKFKTFKERYEYLKLGGIVGEETFGFDRYLNQMFYKSEEWKRIRNYVIIRDNGCDLGIQDRKIIDGIILVHHMNPITKEDIINKNEILLDPEYLITTVKNTHDAIHYGDKSLLVEDLVERSANDTCLWKR